MAGCEARRRNAQAFCSRFGENVRVADVKIEVEPYGNWWDVRCNSCRFQETVTTGKEDAILAANFHQMTDHPLDLVAITIT